MRMESLSNFIKDRYFVKPKVIKTKKVYISIKINEIQFPWEWFDEYVCMQ